MSVGRYTQSYSVGGITGTVLMPIGVYWMGCTLAQSGEYERTVRVLQRRCFMSNYFDYLFRPYVFVPGSRTQLTTKP